MYPLIEKDNALWVGERCLGEIIEVVVVQAGSVNGNVAEYATMNHLLIRIPVNSEVDRFLARTMFTPIWIWCDNGQIRFASHDRRRSNAENGAIDPK
jgi:hypothetical protein